ncbi:hypothetical protein HDU91_002049 [Kappamyces sp. JEL0680]|nr:hypothetical protein HDU91_002049 [Kappamyces sp. JEL0680]
MSVLNRFILPHQMRDRVKTRLAHYGTHDWHGESIPEVYMVARDCYIALANKLGDQLYLLGSIPTTLDAIAFSHLCLHSFPSMATPTLFSILVNEFPTLLAYVERCRPLFTASIVKSPHERPTLQNLIRDVWSRPDSYMAWVFNGFTPTLADENDATLKERRVAMFYNQLSIVGALGFFGLFVHQHQLIRFKKVELPDDDDDDE